MRAAATGSTARVLPATVAAGSPIGSCRDCARRILRFRLLDREPMNRIPMVGEPAPWFHAQALDGNARYAFDTAAGRWIVMLFAGQGSRPELRPALELLASNRDLFD